MKNISNYVAKKYSETERYSFVEEGIYLSRNVYDSIEDGLYVYKQAGIKSSKMLPDYYVTSLSFEQEPDLGEGESPRDISQYPMEDILDKFFVSISDFYEKLNSESISLCFYEFFSEEINDVKNLRGIIGKHVYNNSSKLVIEDNVATEEVKKRIPKYNTTEKPHIFEE